MQSSQRQQRQAEMLATASNFSFSASSCSGSGNSSNSRAASAVSFCSANSDTACASTLPTAASSTTVADRRAPLNGVVLGVGCDQLLQLQLQTPSSVAVYLTTHATDGKSEKPKHLATAAGTRPSRCWPPPLFILLVSLLELGCFVYDCTAPAELLAGDSLLIYRPDRRLQLWRFISYALLHANWLHLGFNVATQLLYGVPLELLHGSLRIAIIYLAGVLAGALGTSVVDSTVYLVGASGGVYALLAAQLANVLLNYGHMRQGLLQLVAVAIFVCCDLGYALYSRQLAVEATLPTVSYIAHMTGALAGFTVGLLVLQNFEGGLRSRLLRWLALGVWAAFTSFAIAFNLINTMTVQLLAEQEGEVLKQHLMHDLGIS